MLSQAVNNTSDYPSSYREVKIGKTLYRVTSVYKGEIDLKSALEDLAVRRIVCDSIGSFDNNMALL